MMQNLSSCRVCRAYLPDKPLLCFENMPKAAQMMPGIDDLVLDKGITLSVFQCQQCGLVQTTGEPVSYYREVIRAAAYSPEMQLFREQQFTDFVNRYQLKNKPLLEVGCGGGEYLSIFQKTGVKPWGIEYGQQAVNTCQQMGLEVNQLFIESANVNIPGAPFAAFAILNFMEHWPDPCVTLSGLANNLSDGAIGLIEVPNFDMILKKRLFSEFISDHIFYFTQETLETTLRLNQFEVLSCQSIWHDYILSAVVRKRPVIDTSNFTAQSTKLQQQLDDFIQYHSNRGVVIWGAGHQALATLAILGIHQGIRYVVDSAPFKQGKFTPATHLPIVPPSHLKQDKVGAIIVMAASYSDEVVDIIRSNYDKTLAIAVLRDHGLELL